MSTDDSDGSDEEVRDRPEDRADELDGRLVDLLSWVLDTETRARIYVYLRGHAESTSREIAEGTGLYPSTVRESLADLHEDGTVVRTKREAAGAGNNPYEYEAIPPTELVDRVVKEVQRDLNTVYHMDEYLGDARPGDALPGDCRLGDGSVDGPVTVEIASESLGTGGDAGRVQRTDGESGERTVGPLPSSDERSGSDGGRSENRTRSTPDEYREPDRDRR